MSWHEPAYRDGASKLHLITISIEWKEIALKFRNSSCWVRPRYSFSLLILYRPNEFWKKIWKWQVISREKLYLESNQGRKDELRSFYACGIEMSVSLKTSRVIGAYKFSGDCAQSCGAAHSFYTVKAIFESDSSHVSSLFAGGNLHIVKACTFKSGEGNVWKN